MICFGRGFFLLQIIYTLFHYYAQQIKNRTTTERSRYVSPYPTEHPSPSTCAHTSQDLTIHTKHPNARKQPRPCLGRLRSPGFWAKLVARTLCVEPGCHRHTTDEVRLELAVSNVVSTMLRPQPAGMGNTNVSTADVQCTSVMEAMHAYAHMKDLQSQSSVRAHSSNAGRRFDRHRFSRALRCVGNDSQALRRRTEQRASAHTIESVGRSIWQELPSGGAARTA